MTYRHTLARRTAFYSYFFNLRTNPVCILSRKHSFLKGKLILQKIAKNIQKIKISQDFATARKWPLCVRLLLYYFLRSYFCVCSIITHLFTSEVGRNALRCYCHTIHVTLPQRVSVTVCVSFHDPASQALPVWYVGGRKRNDESCIGAFAIAKFCRPWHDPTHNVPSFVV